MRQLSDLKKAMKGVDIVLPTPFNKDDSLDLEGMRANTRWLLERTAGKDFILTPVGSTGEFYAMSDDECKAVIKMTVEETNGRNVVLAGTGRAGALETVRLCQYAQSVGADGAQVILPYYHIPYEEGMYLHYKQIAESVDPNFGIMIYNNAAVSGSWIKPQLMQKISRIPNIIAIKENTPYIMSYLAERRTVDPKDAVILIGIGEQMFSFAALYGCPGFISEIANFAPEISYSLYEAAAARDFDKVTELINFLAPFSSFIGRVTTSHGPHTGVAGRAVMYVSVFKAVMDIVGLRGGELRLPMLPLNEEEKTELRNILKDMKII